MKMLVTFASLAAAVSFGAPASAQTYSETIYDLRDGVTVHRVSDINDPRYGALPPFEVLTIVRSMGFDPQSQPVLRGRVYIVRAFDDQDIPVRVAVDAHSGRVLRVAERVAGRFGQPVDEDSYGAYPVPPSALPNGVPYREQPYGGPLYRGSDATTYSPAPYPPPPSVAPRTVAPRTVAPRLAARTPAATPTPRAKPQEPKAAAVTKPAAPASAAPAATASTTPVTPQGATTKTPAAATAASTVAQDTGHRGVSIPAPVANRKPAAPADETAAKPAEPQAASPKADLSLVPVAPLE
jgi:hypothetical protein